MGLEYQIKKTLVNRSKGFFVNLTLVVAIIRLVYVLGEG